MTVQTSRPAPLPVPLVLLAVLLPACTGSGGGHGLPEEMRAPVAGSVLGNWTVDGDSIVVIEDTGRPHEVRHGNAVRISSRGVEVLVNAFVQPGGIREQARLGQTYELDTRAAGDRFFCSLVTEPGIVDGELVNLECTGVLVGERLNVSYTVIWSQDGAETERDELTFQCVPGGDVDTQQDGRWQVDEFRVVQNTCSLLDGFSLRGDLLIQNGRVVLLFDESFVADTYLKRWGQVQAGLYDKVETGRMECFVSMVSNLLGPPIGKRYTFFFMDLVRSGDRLTGRLHAVQTFGTFGPPTITDIDITYRRR